MGAGETAAHAGKKIIMEYLPIFLNVRNRPCLVVGGGEVAARKIEILLRAGAKVTVVSPELCPGLAQLRDEGKIHQIPSPFKPEQIAQVVLVYAATDDNHVNRQVFELANSLGIPVNVVDTPELCTFIMPSILERSPLTIAVSTGGASPVLARLARARLETVFPATFGRLGIFAESYREIVKKHFTAPEMRRIFWEKILQGSIAEMVLAGREAEAHKLFKESLTEEPENSTAIGEAYIIGYGSGDPDLMTFKALRLLQQADIVLATPETPRAVLDLARRDAKQETCHENLLDRLVTLVRQNKRVAILLAGTGKTKAQAASTLVSLESEGFAVHYVPGIAAEGA